MRLYQLCPDKNPSGLYLYIVRNERRKGTGWKVGWAHGGYQHGGAQVELLGQLRDVDVDGDELQGVHLLHFPDDVGHPLKLTLGPRHPDKVNLGKKCTRIVFI